MGNLAVRVEGLGKRYRIGSKRQHYRTLRDTLADALFDPFKKAQQLLRGQAYAAAGLEEIIWALRDVSFDVEHGEVIGIIGRNGAGKSTLLKILSRITEPTEGFVDIYGRVGALLEVGTGFHPELTGRENIYLNGAILGMARAEIHRKFDEIVNFSGVEKFIDTPVKHYSSGMGLRLGFSVAAHLEPEILVVDEVLAVGDAEFQAKCLGKMSEVAGQGRTVLFVSHNMSAILSLCSQAILLDQGVVINRDTPSAIVSYYLDTNGTTSWESNSDTQEIIKINRIYISQPDETAIEYLDPTLPIDIVVEYSTKEPIQNMLLGFDVLTGEGLLLFRTYFTELMKGLQIGEHVSILTLSPNIFRPEKAYYLEFLLGIHRTRWIHRNYPRIKLNFRTMPSTDIDFAGVLQDLGQWKSGTENTVARL